MKILAFGDSLTAGYKLAPAESYPAQLEAILKHEGFDVSIANAGVSGDTSTQALARVNWSLKRGPYDIVLLGIGANDALRMMPLDVFEKNLRALIEKFSAAGARVLLLGMKMPFNLDPKYRARFEKIYRDAARDEKISLLPFMLEGVATDERLNLEDQMHPNAKGYAIVARNVAKSLRPLLKAREVK